jgi:hypothetical protein
MKRHFIPLVVLAAIGLVGDRASAGYKGDSDLFLNTSSSNGSAGGTLGDVRNDGDPTAYIGCYTYSLEGVGTEYGSCYASSGIIYKQCLTTDPAIIATIGAITPISEIYFSWDYYANCTYLSVTNWSYNTPMTP